MSKRFFRDVEKVLGRLGYELASECGATNPHRIYSHPSAPDVSVNPSINEGPARQLIRQLTRLHGAETRRPKRNVIAIREREARRREDLKAADTRLAAERAEIIRRRDALLDGAGAHLGNADIAALEARVRELDTARRELERLMTETPVPAAHGGRSAGRAKHRSGVR